MSTARSATDVPFWERHVTLGCVLGGAVTFFQNKTEKREELKSAVSRMEQGAVYFLAWTGQYMTDLFAVTADDISRWSSG